jgi:hypothetical protein
MPLFRHKTVRRFSVAGFEFKDHKMRLDEEKAKKFRELVATLPAREQVQIVEVNEEAAAASEKPVAGPTVVRGPAQAKDILTDADRKRLAENQTPSNNGVNIPTSNPTGAGAGNTAQPKK